MNKTALVQRKSRNRKQWAENAFTNWAEWWLKHIEDADYPSKTAEERWRSDGGISSGFFGPSYPASFVAIWRAPDDVKIVDRVMSATHDTILRDAVICRYFPVDRLFIRVRLELPDLTDTKFKHNEQDRAIAFARGLKSSVGTYRMMLTVARYLVLHERDMSGSRYTTWKRTNHILIHWLLLAKSIYI